ncbi:guanitoxin biosynthesis heme-dependent pre-guanitoxin N-hydroxylase GntA [Saccharopolyspora shandongensis]|uniref:guanitoxin biosynthesis heme-dependent pre-guanitoxin N-hydroxylase GntA n=1 Tax=Saccharopolyspora shandongensis TaxID=418495 RepID=UPI003449EFFB
MGSRSEEVREALCAFIASDRCSCVGAKTALGRGTLVHRHYGPLGGAENTARLLGDLRGFVRDRHALDPYTSTFVATFEGPQHEGERRFEQLLWSQLQKLHDVDSRDSGWAHGYAVSPELRDFAFCVGGDPFFIVGMHDEASRISRRFRFPTLVFNSHEQFRELDKTGAFRRIREETRSREIRLQGFINPNLIKYASEEARHYAGRMTEPEWQCPFRAHVLPRPVPNREAKCGHRTSTVCASENCLVRCVRSNVEFCWQREDGRALLDLCLQAGVPVEWLCRAGVCGRCATRVCSGRTTYSAEPHRPPPPGEVLLCLAQPVSDVALDL